MCFTNASSAHISGMISRCDYNVLREIRDEMQWRHRFKQEATSNLEHMEQQGNMQTL